MSEIYAPRKRSFYIPADRDPLSRLIRGCGWICWIGELISIGLLIFRGMTQARNPFARTEWVCYFLFCTGNVAMHLVERRRRNKKKDIEES
jgi:hypothetical protein